MKSIFTLLSLFLFSQSFAAKPQITQYSLPPSSPSTPQSPPPPSTPLPGLLQSTQSFPTPTWSAPNHWQERHSNPMRKGDFLIQSHNQQAELTITVFPGDVGGLLPNINRWASQINAPELSSPQNLPQITIDSLPATLIELDGSSNYLLGAILPLPNCTWFFKFTGPKSLLLNEKSNFLNFLQSVSFPK